MCVGGIKRGCGVAKNDAQKSQEVSAERPRDSRLVPPHLDTIRSGTVDAGVAAGRLQIGALVDICNKHNKKSIDPVVYQL